MPPSVSVDAAPFPSVFAITLLSPFIMQHLVVDEIPPGSHLIHIPDLQTKSQFLEASQTIEEGHFVQQTECLSSYWENDDQID